MLATLRNCSYKFFGINVKMVYSGRRVRGWGEIGLKGAWKLTRRANFVPGITKEGFIVAVHFGHWQGPVHVDRPPLTGNGWASRGDRVLCWSFLRGAPSEKRAFLLLVVQKNGSPPLCTLFDGRRLSEGGSCGSDSPESQFGVD